MANHIATERDAIFAEEAFVVDVQILLNRIMKEKGFSRADLARELSVSRARITQIFSDECKNLTIRLLARVLHALGENPIMMTEKLCDEMLRNSLEDGDQELVPTEKISPLWAEAALIDESSECRPANDNLFAGLAQMRQSRVDFRMAA